LSVVFIKTAVDFQPVARMEAKIDENF